MKLAVFSVGMLASGAIGAAESRANYTDAFTLALAPARPQIEYKCSARDESGQRYVASGRNPGEVQEKAINECSKAFSGNCYRTGCTQVPRGRTGS